MTNGTPIYVFVGRNHHSAVLAEVCLNLLFPFPNRDRAPLPEHFPQLQPSEKHTPPEPTSLVPPEILPFALPSSNTERFKTHSSRGGAAA